MTKFVGNPLLMLDVPQLCFICSKTFFELMFMLSDFKVTELSFEVI